MTPFARELVAHIREYGPITVADYMARCDAQYYATRDPFGSSGDFTTAPEISQIFGELVGAWTAHYWQAAGLGKATLCELGPGRGTLMKDALRATRAVAGFHEAVSLQLVEASPVLRAVQQGALAGLHPRIAWQERLDRFPPLPLLLIANEFFDALPAQQFVTGPQGEIERRVRYYGERLAFSPEGAVTKEASPDSLAVIAKLAEHIARHGGAALIVDYGYNLASPRRGEAGRGAEDGMKAVIAPDILHSTLRPHPNPPPTGEGIRGDTLQAVRRHRYADPLEQPGEADLTAHVDFGALADEARIHGAQVHGPVEQGMFLKRLGAELRAAALCKARPDRCDTILSGLERLVSPAQMGELFKVMAVTSSADKAAGFD